MTVQTVPYALQNASHSAALFRQATSAPFQTPGILGVGELAVSQQGTPNMSVILGPGRGKVAGTQVSPPAGLSFTTQAMYDVLNDANVTLTVTTSNPSNPRIDAVYIGVQDSFYSGASNTALAGIVAGTPGASPVAPAIPANSLLVAYIAVGANVTSIVTANITMQAAIAGLLAGVKTYAGVPLTGSQANGTVVASQVIPVRTVAQRVLVTMAGSIAAASGGGGGYLVVATGATITGNSGQVAVTSSGTAYAMAVIVDIPANAAVTIQIQVTSSLPVIWGFGAWCMEVLSLGAY